MFCGQPGGFELRTKNPDMRQLNDELDKPQGTLLPLQAEGTLSLT
jgi:hypothetical protein